MQQISNSITITITTQNVSSFPTNTLTIQVLYANGTAAADASVSASTIGSSYYWGYEPNVITWTTTGPDGYATLVTPTAPEQIDAWSWLPLNLTDNHRTASHHRWRTSKRDWPHGASLHRSCRLNADSSPANNGNNHNVHTTAKLLDNPIRSHRNTRNRLNNRRSKLKFIRWPRRNPSFSIRPTTRKPSTPGDPNANTNRYKFPHNQRKHTTPNYFSRHSHRRSRSGKPNNRNKNQKKTTTIERAGELNNWFAGEPVNVTGPMKPAYIGLAGYKH